MMVQEEQYSSDICYDDHMTLVAERATQMVPHYTITTRWYPKSSNNDRRLIMHDDDDDNDDD